MGAAAKNPISKLMPTPSQQVSRVLFNDSAARIRIMDIKEAIQLAQFVTVIVLVPEPPAEDGRAQSQNARSNPLYEKLATSRIAEFFHKTITQPKARSAESDLVFGDVKISFSSMEASRQGIPVMLTALEFKTLKYLAHNERRVISRDELLKEVWGYENYPCTRTVDNHILRLRQKLEKDPSRPIHLRTVHGAGYKFLP